MVCVCARARVLEGGVSRGSSALHFRRRARTAAHSSSASNSGGIFYDDKIKAARDIRRTCDIERRTMFVPGLFPILLCCVVKLSVARRSGAEDGETVEKINSARCTSRCLTLHITQLTSAFRRLQVRRLTSVTPINLQKRKTILFPLADS